MHWVSANKVCSSQFGLFEMKYEKNKSCLYHQAELFTIIVKGGVRVVPYFGINAQLSKTRKTVKRCMANQTLCKSCTYGL